MSLYQTIEEDLKQALKSKDSIRVSILRMVKSGIKNKEIEARRKLEEGEIIQVISSLVKQHRDSIEQFKSGGRQDLVEKEELELEILQSYMPPQLTEEELKASMAQIISELGATGIKDMGRVMKTAMERHAGQADGKLVNQIVKAMLAG